MQFRALKCDQCKASLNRRDFLEMSFKAAVVACFGTGLPACSAIPSQSRLINDSNGSKFGFWRVAEGLPEFVYTVALCLLASSFSGLISFHNDNP